jgi:hypothetical protein
MITVDVDLPLPGQRRTDANRARRQNHNGDFRLMLPGDAGLFSGARVLVVGDLVRRALADRRVRCGY